jgi:signal transduction histidine kinase
MPTSGVNAIVHHYVPVLDEKRRILSAMPSSTCIYKNFKDPIQISQDHYLFQLNYLVVYSPQLWLPRLDLSTSLKNLENYHHLPQHDLSWKPLMISYSKLPIFFLWIFLVLHFLILSLFFFIFLLFHLYTTYSQTNSATPNPALPDQN